MADPQDGQQHEPAVLLLDRIYRSEEERKKKEEVLELQREVENQSDIECFYPLEDQGAASPSNDRENKRQDSHFPEATGERELDEEEYFATGEPPGEEPEEDATIRIVPSLMTSSSGILWAMPIAPPTPRGDSGQLPTDRELAHKSTNGLSSGPKRQRKQQCPQQSDERREGGDLDADALRGFLQQFHEVLPSKAAADCVVCALRPVRPDGCGDSCSCCSEEKKAAVQRLKHQFAVVLPSSGITADELLQQAMKQQRLAKMLRESRNTADRYEQRLLSAEGKKQELQQKVHELLERQRILQEEVSASAIQFREQQEAWERKGRLQQSQLQLLSAKLKTYSEELESLRRLRLLESAGNHEQLQQQQVRTEESHQRPEGPTHVRSRPRSCTAVIRDRKSQRGSPAAVDFRLRSKTEHKGTMSQLHGGTLEKPRTFEQEKQRESNSSLGSEESDSLQQGHQQVQQLLHQRQEQGEGGHGLTDSTRQKFEKDSRQRAHTSQISSQFLLRLQARDAQLPSLRQQPDLEGCHARSSPAKSGRTQGRKMSALLPGLLPRGATSPLMNRDETEAAALPSAVYTGRGDSRKLKQHIVQWPQELTGEEDFLQDGREEAEGSLSSLRFELENSDNGSPGGSPVSRVHRLQSCFVPGSPGFIQRTNGPSKAQLRSATQLPQSLNLQLESIRQQLLAGSGDRITGITQQQQDVQKLKTIATTASAPARSNAQLQHEVQWPQNGLEATLLSRTARAMSAAAPNAPPSVASRVRSMMAFEPATVVVPMEQPTGNRTNKDSSQAADSEGITTDQSRGGNAPPQHQRHQQEEGRRSFECTYFSNNHSEEESKGVSKDAEETEMEPRPQEHREKEKRQCKVVRWRGRSMSCSFAAERASTNRLLYLMPRGETLHPRKLQQLLQEDELAQEKLQFVLEQEVPTAKGFEGDEQQQDACPSEAKRVAEGAGEQRSPLNPGRTESGDEGKEATADNAVTESSFAGEGSKPPTPAFPQPAEAANAALRFAWAYGDQLRLEQPVEQQQEQRPPVTQVLQPSLLQQQSLSPQAGGSAVAPLHSTVPFPNQQQQQPVPWVAAPSGLAGGFVAAPAQLQTGGFASCPVALQPVASLSPRPVLVMYTSSCLSQQVEAKESFEFSAGCKPVSGYQGGGSSNSSENVSGGRKLPVRSNGAACCYEIRKEVPAGPPLVQGPAKHDLPAAYIANGEDQSSGSSCTEPWCLLCESGPQPIRPGGEQATSSAACNAMQEGAEPKGPRAPNGVSSGGSHSVAKPTGEGVVSSTCPPATPPVKEQDPPRKPSQPSVSSPRKILPPQPAEHTDSAANPQQSKPAQAAAESAATEAAGATTASKGSPRGWSKPTWLQSHIRQPPSRGRGGNQQQAQTLPQPDLAKGERLRESQQQHQQQHPQHQQQAQEQQTQKPQRPPALQTVAAAAVATQTSLMLPHGGRSLTPAGVSALHSQPVLHREGVDYLNPAAGDNASLASVSSGSSVKNYRSIDIQLPLHHQPDNQRETSRVSAAAPYPPFRTAASLLHHPAKGGVEGCANKSVPMVPSSSVAGKSMNCRKEPPAEAAGAAEPPPQASAVGEVTHEQLEQQIMQLQRWQTQLHQQQHAQHRRLVQQQRLFQQQQRLLQEQQQEHQRRQRDWAGGSQQRSVTPQVQQQSQLQIASISVPYVDMGPHSGGLVYMQVQDSPSWFPKCPVQKHGPLCTVPPLAVTTTAATAMAPPANMQRNFLGSLTPRAPTASRDRPLNASTPANKAVPTPVPPMLAAAPCMLMPLAHSTGPPGAAQPPAPPSYAAPQAATARHPTAMLFQR